MVDDPLYSHRAGVAGMAELLRRDPTIDGAFAASDAVAAGAMEALRATGRSVPDVRIVGFDDSAWALRCSPGLSTVRQPAEDMGRAAASLVLQQLSGGDSVGNVRLPTEIVRRGSA